ncbi:hypothetical protein CALCODRAFT_496831 [Calocera cornea HHB12733]|uniref:Phosphatidylglycerol/phosphatidylinositol transfer protein n=1 Tax=Calocera cornea HHB12733 TaxID=1353952 RepID=A0A165FJK3_9BASI|nr:hypothetical protein CALCODRAFT_496831 [Calocera cornea HHB12733]
MMLVRTLSRTFALFIVLLPLVSALRALPHMLWTSEKRPPSIQWRWQDLGRDTDLIDIESISVSPDPPRPGEPVSVFVSGRTAEVIDRGAQYFVELKYGSSVLSKGWRDFCALTLESGYYCPILPGEFHLEETFDLPANVPSGKFTVLTIGQTKGGAEMFFVRSEIQVGK